MSRSSKGEAVRVGRRTVEITRPDKVLFPKDGVSKRELVEYYRRIAPTMIPHLRGRAIAMQRYPDGIGEPGFFQKKISGYYPAWIETATLRKKGGTVRHVICEDAATLMYLANQAAVTLHTWLSRVDKPDHPDQLIFDFDPSDGDFRAICRAAKALRKRLASDGLTAYVKTTGSRGLHVLVPLDRTADFDAVRAYAREIAEALAEEKPPGSQDTARVRRAETSGESAALRLPP